MEQLSGNTPFFSQVTEGIDQACKDEGYELQVTYFYENRDINAQIESLSEKNCQGILLLGTEMEVNCFQPFTKLKVPLVASRHLFRRIKL